MCLLPQFEFKKNYISLKLRKSIEKRMKFLVVFAFIVAGTLVESRPQIFTPLLSSFGVNIGGIGDSTAPLRGRIQTGAHKFVNRFSGGLGGVVKGAGDGVNRVITAITHPLTTLTNVRATIDSMAPVGVRGTNTQSDDSAVGAVNLPSANVGLQFGNVFGRMNSTKALLAKYRDQLAKTGVAFGDVIDSINILFRANRNMRLKILKDGSISKEEAKAMLEIAIANFLEVARNSADAVKLAVGIRTTIDSVPAAVTINVVKDIFGLLRNYLVKKTSDGDAGLAAGTASGINFNTGLGDISSGDAGTASIINFSLGRGGLSSGDADAGTIVDSNDDGSMGGGTDGGSGGAVSGGAGGAGGASIDLGGGTGGGLFGGLGLPSVQFGFGA